MKEIKLTALLGLFFFTALSQSKNFLDLPYVEVAGSADSLVTPNEIYIKINLSEKDTKDKMSLEELEQRMYDGLKGLGVDVEKNLTTSDMASNFKTYFLKSKDIMKSKQYMLKVGDAVIASKVFIALENIGISNTSIDRVSHSDLEHIKNELRSRAVENARVRAVALTRPLNQNLGPAIHIADNEVYNLNIQRANGLDEVVVVGYGARRKAGVDLPTIGFEQMKLSANINVKFILKP